MKTGICILMVTAAALAQTASAGETRIERKQTCVCTSGADVPPGAPPPSGGAMTWQMQTDDDVGGGAGEDVNVQVFKNEQGGERHVVIVRRAGHDSADANKDGKVTRREFLDRAEKHFAEMDKNHDGSLSKEEAQPAMPPMPSIPGMPPIPPVPPAPPAPPAPPPPQN